VAAFPEDQEPKSQELIIGLLQNVKDPFSRTHFTPGHITSTGLVLSPDHDAVLIVRHKRLKRWLLPGGHLESTDENLSSGAHREVLEETGVEVERIEAFLAGMDVHGIPGKGNEPYHLHHDLKFAFIAKSKDLRGSEETEGAAWCPLSEGDFDDYDLPDSVRRAIWRAVD
jgi:8-oxo-dGTP pyrophosphatase MutT (NUDIX family)